MSRREGKNAKVLLTLGEYEQLELLALEAENAGSLEEIRFLHEQIEKLKIYGKRKYLESRLKESENGVENK